MVTSFTTDAIEADAMTLAKGDILLITRVQHNGTILVDHVSDEWEKLQPINPSQFRNLEAVVNAVILTSRFSQGWHFFLFDIARNVDSRMFRSYVSVRH